MNTIERRGFLIIVVVFLYSVTVMIYLQLPDLVAAVNAERVHWNAVARHVIIEPGVFLVALLLWGWAIRKGHEFARWAGLAGLVCFGVFFIWLAVWLTTLDYPHVTPEEREVMQAYNRRQLPWEIGRGVLHIIVGATLSLPSVGAFMRYRRRVGGGGDLHFGHEHGSQHPFC
jgi:hypothetical protein